MRKNIFVLVLMCLLYILPKECELVSYAYGDDRTIWEWNNNPLWEEMPFTCDISLADKQPANGVLRLNYEILAARVPGTHIYNPFLQDSLRYTNYQALVFDQAHIRVPQARNKPEAGKDLQPSSERFVYLPYNARVGYHIDILVNQHKCHHRNLELEPGTYYLQLSFSSMSVTQPPAYFTKDELWPEFLKKLSGPNWKRDYIRSNVIEFEVKKPSE